MPPNMHQGWFHYGYCQVTEETGEIKMLWACRLPNKVVMRLEELDPNAPTDPPIKHQYSMKPSGVIMSSAKLHDGLESLIATPDAGNRPYFTVVNRKRPNLIAA